MFFVVVVVVGRQTRSMMMTGIDSLGVLDGGIMSALASFFADGPSAHRSGSTFMAASNEERRSERAFASPPPSSLFVLLVVCTKAATTTTRL